MKNENEMEDKIDVMMDIVDNLVDEYGGVEIFNEENYSRLNKALLSFDNSFEPAKDWLIIANMKHIPQKLYAVKDATQGRKKEVIEECRNILHSLALNKDVCEGIVHYCTGILNIFIEFEYVEYKPIIGSFVYANHEYKTCQIGNKIWFAENLVREKVSFLLEDYDVGKDLQNRKNGRLYTWNEADACVPRGWRLPTIEDVQDLLTYIEKNSGFNSGTALKAQNEWSGTADPGCDVFGFCAYPTTQNSDTGEPQTWFWTASETGNDNRSHRCMGIKANCSDVVISSAGDGYRACVRYVKDV